MGIKEMFIKQVVIPFVVKFIEDLLTTENLQTWADKLFDFIEDMVVDSKTNWDDKLVLPVVQQMRRALNVPDED